MNNNIIEILKDENKLIEEIKRNGFDILSKYNLMEKYIERNDNGLIKDICFEIKDNPLDTDWDWNGCIFLFFTYKKDTISCQIQLEAMTDVIDYSDYCTYINYNGLKFNPPEFKNETDGFGDYDCNTRCNFSYSYDIEKFKSIRIFNNITKNITKLDKILKGCIKTQEEIYEFESKYNEYKMDMESEDRYDKLYNELTDEEKEDLQWELDGISTYHQMVADGWIDED